MRIAVISMQNNLLSSAIVKYVQERGELRTERIIGSPVRDTLKVCISISADILLMEVTRIPPYTFEQRMKTIYQIREALPDCKVALICDENADPELAERIKRARKDELVDGFFYSSVTGEYLAAMLETL